MGVKKAPNGTWMYDIRHPFTKKRLRPRGFATKADAQLALDLLKEKWRNEKHGTQLNRQVRRVSLNLKRELAIEAELLRLEATDYFTHRLGSTAALIERSLQYIPDELRILELQKSHLEAIANAHLDRGVSPESVRIYLGQLHFAMERIRQRHGQLANWVIPKIKPPEPVKSGKLRRTWTNDELERVLYSLANPPAGVRQPDRWRDVHDVIAIDALTGMRKTEIFLIEWNHISFEMGVLNARTLKRKRVTFREIPMSDALASVLRERRKYIAGKFGLGERFAFPRWQASRNSAQWLYEVLKQAADLAGVEYGQGQFGIVPHGLRHTAATKLLHNGTDLVTAAEILGNSVVTMLNSYSHTTVERKRTAMGALVSK